jgi:glycosyltransferase involved in cell wall biosynthesis
MRIRWILPEASMAGGSKLIAIYAARLMERGHEVVVISTPQPTPTLRSRVRALVREGTWLKDPVRRASHFDNSGIDHRVIESARPITDSDVPDGDLVIATWWETAPAVAKLAPSKGAKVYLMMDYGAPGMELEDLIPTWRLPLHIITISQFLVDLIHENIGDVPVDLVSCSVDTEQFQAPERGKNPVPTVGFLYREDWIKGGDLVLAAFEIARKEIPNLRLITYGPRESLRNDALPDGVEYITYPRDDELKDIYARCDAWLFASRREGFGLPILEAMACRTPVIATPAGASPELIAAHSGGVMVEQEDPSDMAKQIVRFCDMKEQEWKIISRNAFRTARSYTWDESTDQFEACLERIVERQ